MKLANRVALSIAVLAIVLLVSPNQLVAQPPGGGGRGGPGGPGGPGGFFGGGTLGLIQQQEVQKEIELRARDNLTWPFFGFSGLDGVVPVAVEGVPFEMD